jgi:hypothetical protein
MLNIVNFFNFKILKFAAFVEKPNVENKPTYIDVIHGKKIIIYIIFFKLIKLINIYFTIILF